MTLVATLAALERDDHATALREALDAWAGRKHERITAVIETLSKRVAKRRQPPGGNKVAEKQAAWLALAAKGDPGDIEHLLAKLDEARKRPELEARLTALAGRIDPRIAEALCRLVEHPPIPGWTGRFLVRQALQMIVAIGDRASIGALEHVARVNATGGGAATHVLREALPGTLSALQAIATSTLEPQTANVLAMIEGELAREPPPRDPAPLFAAVYANPDDDGPRAVLADLLQELGDPRGEFIALQLARGRRGKKSRREAALLKEHGRAWLGAIAAAIPKTGAMFERGFVSQCRTINERRLSGSLTICASPEWATVEQLELGPWRHVEELLAAMPALRVLTTEGNAGELASHAKLEEIHVKFIYQTGDAERLATLEFPALREFTVQWCYATLREIRPFLERTRSLRRLYLDTRDLAAAIPWLAEQGYERAGVRETMNPFTLWFEGDRLTAEYRSPYGHPHPEAGQQLVQLLDLVPSPARRHLVVDLKAQLFGTDVGTIRRIAAAAVKRFGSHSFVIE